MAKDLMQPLDTDASLGARLCACTRGTYRVLCTQQQTPSELPEVLRGVLTLHHTVRSVKGVVAAKKHHALIRGPAQLQVLIRVRGWGECGGESWGTGLGEQLKPAAHWPEKQP